MVGLPPLATTTRPNPPRPMKINPAHYRVTGRKPLRLKHWPTAGRPLYRSEKHYHRLLARDIGELSELQRLLYASNRHAVLLIFQSMDAAGKDGAIGHVLTGINPQGCEVHSFKHPSAEELEHDFLWRSTCRLPARGRIGVFNRSYYEEVLIVRVHPEILAAQGLPEGLADKNTIWSGRYRSIVDLEKHLHRNGTQVIKFFLHLSKPEQRRRFLARIDEPEKNWKFSQADLTERRFWNHYRHAYEACLRATSTEAAPWHVVPADDKLNARLIVSRIVIETLQALPLQYPRLDRKRRREFAAIRRELNDE